MTKRFFGLARKCGIFKCIEDWLVTVKVQQRAHVDGCTWYTMPGSFPCSAVQDKANLLKAQEPAAGWTPRTIHSYIGEVFDSLLTHFGTVLMLFVRLTKPLPDA